MDPLSLLSILSMGSSIGGLFVKDDSSARWRQQYEQLKALLNPQTIGADATGFYNQWRRSPAYSNSVSAALSGAQAGQQSIMRSFGARGLSGTGLGALSGAGAAAGGLAVGNLNAKAWMDALNQAMQLGLGRLGGVGAQQSKFGFPDKYAAFNDTLSKGLLYAGQSGKDSWWHKPLWGK